MTGRTIPFRPKLAREWPKSIREIVTDAIVAAAENDVPARLRLFMPIECTLGKGRIHFDLAGPMIPPGNANCSGPDTRLPVVLQDIRPAIRFDELQQ